VKRFFQILVSAATTFARAPRPAQVGMVLIFAAAVADGILMPFFALWAHKDAGIPIEYIGLLLGCYAGGELLATPFVGGIADRIGRRPVLLVSTCGVGFGFLLLYLVHGAAAAAAALIIIGVFESVLHPTASTVIADVVPAETRREHFAARRVMSNAGSMAGPALGALLALHSLGLVFLGAGFTILASALVVAVFLTETRPPAAAPGEDDNDDESLLVLTAVFRDSRLAGLIVPVALLEIAASWIAAITPLYADAGGTLTSSGIGLLFTYAGALGVVLQMPITQASERMSGFSIVLCRPCICLPVRVRRPAVARRRGDAVGAGANAGRAAGADDHHRARAAHRAGDLSGRLRRGQRSQRCRGPGDRHLALCARRRTAVGERRRHIARRCARPRRGRTAARQTLRARRNFITKRIFIRLALLVRLVTVTCWRNGVAARPRHVRTVAPLRAKPFPANVRA
jgi:MFS transporter, DHA1 family, tetracycline resistance protein